MFVVISRKRKGRMTKFSDIQFSQQLRRIILNYFTNFIWGSHALILNFEKFLACIPLKIFIYFLLHLIENCQSHQLKT